ncbi:caspase, EACC1-associated type [Actinomadura opuntiae]|uniref:caspase, EACC1-associated type n=1 Tax=Actinomadura sp. OS1-43 TaxID=604315 RepID=UPI00255B3FF2|nr:caspase family protein [Actinomadura sp. OS1-43]MDL4816266.1 caspase family protein [Actinomadura sp. OS1-43]
MADARAEHRPRRALLITADRYADPKLHRLRSPAQDAAGLSAVLSDPAVGDFSVATVCNRPAHEIMGALEDLFADARPADVLLVHFSCHGWKDESGRLFFATTPTRLDRPNSTAVPASYLSEQIAQCRSRNIVVLLDCCYSGAFSRGLLHRGGGAVDVTGPLGGSGRAVICSSSALEYSFEVTDGLLSQAPASADAAPSSIFTGAVVRGLRTGDADLNGDGLVSIDELYEYAYDATVAATPHQTPTKYLDVQGELMIARSPRGPRPATLPPDLLAAATSPLADVRGVAVEALRRLARAGGALGRPAYERLVAMADDDSREVSSRAQAAIRDVDLHLGRSDAFPVPGASRGPSTLPASGVADTSGAGSPPFASPAPPAPPPPRRPSTAESPLSPAPRLGVAAACYFMPFFSSLFLLLVRDREARYHAWQCALIDAFDMVFLLVGSIIGAAYSGVRYGADPIPQSDPGLTGFTLVFLLLPPVLRAFCLVSLARRRRPRITGLGRVAERLVYRRGLGQVGV